MDPTSSRFVTILSSIRIDTWTAEVRDAHISAKASASQMTVTVVGRLHLEVGGLPLEAEQADLGDGEAPPSYNLFEAAEGELAPVHASVDQAAPAYDPLDAANPYIDALDVWEAHARRLRARGVTVPSVEREDLMKLARTVSPDVFAQAVFHHIGELAEHRSATSARWRSPLTALAQLIDVCAKSNKGEAKRDDLPDLKML